MLMQLNRSLLASLLPAVLTAVALAQPQRPSFRLGIDVVSLNVTVTDAENHYVTDLHEADFVVYEDGVQQDVTFFNRTQLPIALALLMDTSASMEERMAMAQAAAIGFAERLRAEDLASVIDFDSRVNVLQEFTHDGKLLETAIRRTAAGGSTSLYNALYISLKQLATVEVQRTEDIRRQAIVLLSDGEDTSSLVTFDEVLELAKRSETSVYAIALRAREERSRTGFREADYVLRQLSQETGGRAFFLENANELPAIYQKISDELSSQYTLGYTSKNPKRDGRWRRIVVRLSRTGVMARTKQGYYAPSAN